MYGEPKRELRRQTWDLFHMLNNRSELPWCMIGDMNNLGSQLEKRGGRQYPNCLIEGFRDVLNNCDLVDLELQEHLYTRKYGRVIEK